MFLGSSVRDCSRIPRPNRSVSPYGNAPPPGYLDLLKSRNVAHVFNAWTRMPALDDQAQIPEAFTADFTVVRALLKRGRGYEDAVKTFEPYKLIQEPNEGARTGMVEIVNGARKRKIPAFLFVKQSPGGQRCGDDRGGGGGTLNSLVDNWV